MTDTLRAQVAELMVEAFAYLGYPRDFLGPGELDAAVAHSIEALGEPAALGGSVPSPSPDADVLRERFKRALDKLLYAHGEWASCRSGDLQRETLADKAVAAENVVLALYADSLGAPAPSADPTP